MARTKQIENSRTSEVNKENQIETEIGLDDEEPPKAMKNRVPFLFGDLSESTDDNRAASSKRTSTSGNALNELNEDPASARCGESSLADSLVGSLADSLVDQSQANNREQANLEQVANSEVSTVSQFKVSRVGRTSAKSEAELSQSFARVSESLLELERSLYDLFGSDEPRPPSLFRDEETVQPSESAVFDPAIEEEYKKFIRELEASRKPL